MQPLETHMVPAIWCWLNALLDLTKSRKTFWILFPKNWSSCRPKKIPQNTKTIKTTIFKWSSSGASQIMVLLSASA